MIQSLNDMRVSKQKPWDGLLMATALFMVPVLPAMILFSRPHCSPHRDCGRLVVCPLWHCQSRHQAA